MRTTPGRSSRYLVSFLLALMVLLSACSEDGPLSGIELPSTTAPGEPPPETAPPETAPPETAPPETAPPETAPPAEGETPAEDESELSSEDILILVLLGAAAVVAILVATSVASSHSEKKAASQRAARTQSADLIGGFRWVNDQGTPEILRTSDPAMLSRTWQTTNSRIVELESRVASMQQQAPNEETAIALDGVGRSAASLRVALNSDVSLRTDPTMAGRDDLVRSSAQAVQQRRFDLDRALSNLALRSRS